MCSSVPTLETLSDNVFTCFRLEECLEVLISTGRLSEAAFFARTYLPSQVSRYVKPCVQCQPSTKISNILVKSFIVTLSAASEQESLMQSPPVDHSGK